MTAESEPSVGFVGPDSADPPSTTAESQDENADPEAGKALPKLAFYVPSLDTGGAERVTVTLVNELNRRGYDIDLVVSSVGAMGEDLAETVTLVNLDSPRPPGIGIGAGIPGIASYLRSASPAILFPQMTYASVVCAVANAVSGTETVVLPTEHNTLGMKTGRKDRAVSKVAGLLYRDIERVLAVSQGVADSVVASTPLDSDRVTVTHNPIDVGSISDRSTEPVDHPWISSPDHEVVLYVGRHEDQKDLETWLAAFKQINETIPSARGIIAGKGSKREELRFIAEQEGLEDVVSFPGYVDNPYGYMGGADVFMLSSQYEGLPTVLIEALSCGCPVASTDCPSGPSEILAGGEYGSLAPVGKPQKLADTAMSELTDPVDEAALLKRAEDFSPTAVGDTYEQVIQTVLADR